MDCCNCFWFIRKSTQQSVKFGINNNLSQELLLDEDIEDGDGSYDGDASNITSGDDSEVQIHANRSEDILKWRAENDMICRQFLVKETHKVVRTEDENGNKIINEYVREYKIGSGSYGKVVLYRSSVDGKHYAIKNIVHGDIKPDNLLVTRHGTVKTGEFSVSQAFEDDNGELRRSPGTPVFTAPECCLGLPYHGKAADTWAVGVTLYCMILGEYPFLGNTLPDTYDKIVHNPLVLPDNLNLQLKNLLEGLLCKDPKLRLTLGEVAKHSWVIGDDGPIPEYLCCCKRKSLEREDLDRSHILA